MELKDLDSRFRKVEGINVHYKVRSRHPSSHASQHYCLSFFPRLELVKKKTGTKSTLIKVRSRRCFSLALVYKCKPACSPRWRMPTDAESTEGGFDPS